MQRHSIFTLGRIAVSLALNILGVGESQAGSIIQNEISGEISILDYAPVGQTFTAEDSRISTIGFYLDNWTHIYPGGNNLSYSLYEGVGFGGHLLGTSQFTLQEGFLGYADADFSFVSLSIGGKYTASITAPDYDWGVAANNPFWASGDPFPGKIDYTGGEMILSGVLQPLQDLTFRIISIPEPSSIALFLTGGILAANKLIRRRKNERRVRALREGAKACLLELNCGKQCDCRFVRAESMTMARHETRKRTLQRESKRALKVFG